MSNIAFLFLLLAFSSYCPIFRVSFLLNFSFCLGLYLAIGVSSWANYIYLYIDI